MSDDIRFPALEELNGKIEDRSKKLAAIFDEAGPEIDLTKVKSIPGDTVAKSEEIRKLNDELTDLGKERDELTQVHKAAQRVRVAGVDPDGGQSGSEPGAPALGKALQRKTFGEMFVASKAYKERGQRQIATLDVGLKTLFETSAGWEPETTRTGRVVDFATRPVQVTDIVPDTTTGQAAVVYMEETTYGTGGVTDATEVVEGTIYPETTLELTEQSSPVRKIAVWIPVTDEQLEDEPQVRGYLDNRLPFMLRQRLDSQILVGNGTPPNLTGILNTAGIQTQALGTDPIPDAVYKAIVLSRVNGRAMPNAVVFNPFNWQSVRLLRTTDGLYIWGNPSEAGPERIWGLQVTQGDVLTAGTALVGDFANFSELAVRRGIDVQVSNAHEQFFIHGKQAVRADMRVALVVYRPSAFVQVTGL